MSQGELRLCIPVCRVRQVVVPIGSVRSSPEVRQDVVDASEVGLGSYCFEFSHGSRRMRVAWSVMEQVQLCLTLYADSIQVHSRFISR
jgi:hypothetical protein